MNYNYFYEIAAAIICLVIFSDILYKRQFFRKDVKFFINVVVTQGILSVVDLVSCLLLDNAQRVPYWLNMLFIVLYFVLQPILLYCFVAFICSFPEIQKTRFKVFKAVAAVIFLADIIIGITSDYTGWYFVFHKSDLVYRHGIHRVLGYHFYYAACLLVLNFLIENRYSFLRRERTVVVLGGLIIAVSVLAQSIYHLSLITGLGTSIAILLIYITMENPNSFIDRRTEISNSDALRLYVNRWEPDRHRYAIYTIKLSHFDTLEKSLGFEKVNELVLRISRWLEEDLKFKNRIFRLSEDNLVLVAKGTKEDFLPSAELIEEQFKKSWILRGGIQVPVEMKAVLCEYPTHFQNFSSFLNLKEFLMKIPDKSNLILADNKVMERKKRFNDVEEAVRRAVENETLDVYYQPIYDAKERKISGLEALARLTDEKLGYISPEEFIPVAEADGLIMELGILVVKKVCRFASEKLLKMENCTVNKIEINLSPIQLLHRKTIPTIKEIVTEYKIPPSLLNFEITESATADSPEVVMEAMKSLIDFGCDFSLDDYGTGYSNISYLINFEFSKIKFDRQLINSYFTEESAKKILGHEFELIYDLNKDIVAEGIESEEYLQGLLFFAIRYYQGYYFSKALPEDELIAYLQNSTPADNF